MRYTEYHAGKAVVRDKSLLAEAMEKLAKFEDEEESGGWIPCSERLPEDESYILVSFQNFTMPDIARYEENDEGGTFYPGDDEKIIFKLWNFCECLDAITEAIQGGRQ